MSQPTRKRAGNLISLIGLILGALLLLYPIVATLATNEQLRRQADAYSEHTTNLSAEERDAQLARARDYNQRLLATGTHARPPAPNDPDMPDYMAQLNLPGSGGIMARIRIPDIGVDLPVYHTTAPHVLYEGAGHMFGSTLPVGGDGTNAVITAHTGMVNAAMFDALPTLKAGQDIYIDVMGQRLRYQMVSREVVKPDQYQAVRYQPGEDRLTLITCTPYGLNTDRLLVHAIRVPLDPDAPEPRVTGLGISWWMILVALIVLVVLLLILWRWWKRRRREAGQG